MSATPRRLALCFDGTWNTYDSHTNVSRFFETVADDNCGCAEQLKFYDEGVGTTWGTKVAGGAFGAGLSRNILLGYCWLINTYRDGPAAADPDDPSGELFSGGDDIYFFGFSRGAFTARSLCGLINRCGILKRSEFGDQPATPDSDLVKKAWDLYRKKDFPDQPAESRLSEECRKFRGDHAHTVRIKLIGVWDTVGALGVPLFVTAALPIGVFNSRYAFHDTRLGRAVQHARHAIAIDEHRKDFQVTMWTAKHKFTRSLEQRWFAGSHGNVGGGYEDDTLPEMSLLWMAKEASVLGLEFRREMLEAMERNLPKLCAPAPPVLFALDGTEVLSPVRDSYKEFAFGIYAVAKGLFSEGRFFRRILIEEDDPDSNRGFGPGQKVDESVFQKLASDPEYRPANLARSGQR
jgi:uncharacterized protein (DUF2235 family)